MKRKVKRPFDNEQFRKGYVAGIFAAEKELNTELLHFAEKVHKIMSEGTFPDYGVKINFKDSNNTITTNLDMKTEEKAKAYDEAFNKIKPLYEQAKKDGNPIWSTYEYLFPELKENEDERVMGVIRTYPDTDYFYFHDIEDLFVWNDLVHLFDLEHHHKSVLTNGEEVEWYWTYTNDSEQREDGLWYRKEVGYKKIRVPVDAKIGIATTWIPDESIIKDLS